MVGKIIKKINELIKLFEDGKLQMQGAKRPKVQTSWRVIMVAIEAFEVQYGRVEAFEKAKLEIKSVEPIVVAWATTGYYANFQLAKGALEKAKNLLEAFASEVGKAAA